MIIPEALYTKIKRCIPIPCVDLVVTSHNGRILMLKRKNPPAQNQWWFPGGRVHFGEQRRDAAARKLFEECGLASIETREIGTYDVILNMKNCAALSHCITTLFHMCVDDEKVILDDQSSEYKWMPPMDAAKEIGQPLKAVLIRHFELSSYAEK